MTLVIGFRTAVIASLKLLAWLALYALIVVVTNKIAVIEQRYLDSIYSRGVFLVASCAALLKSWLVFRVSGDDLAKNVNGLKYAGLSMALIFEQWFQPATGIWFCFFDCSF